jgi:SAM-dependent methyltransferase
MSCLLSTRTAPVCLGILQKIHKPVRRAYKKMLHFAPEPEFERKLIKVPAIKYVSADLYNTNAMIKMDITNIDYPNESFDFLYCSHVLEHIKDDRKAIVEIYRVLKKGGQAVIVVPIIAEMTFEDLSITNPDEREKMFGQHDHLRKYGPDFKDRLTECNFITNVIYASDFLTEKELERIGLKFIDEKTTPIFFCKKV